MYTEAVRMVVLDVGSGVEVDWAAGIGTVGIGGKEKGKKEGSVELLKCLILTWDVG